MFRFTAGLLLCLVAASAVARAEIPFAEEFKLPAAEKRIWQALNQPTVDDLRLDWRSIDPDKDAQRSQDFWRQWPVPFSPFYAGIKMPPEQFVLSNLYRDGKLRYPQARYEPWRDYDTFLDLHESLAWLYAFDSPANPFFRNRALRLRAQQLALAHLIGMTQSVPGGNIIGGWTIQYGNCLAWNAHVLKLLDDTEPLDPELKSAWLACLDHIASTLDQQGPEVLQTGMGHWNLWPVCGAFRLWQASGDPRHRAILDKWATMQLTPDAFTSNARYVSGVSPAGYVRYSGIDLGYNGQAKNWMSPLFATLGPDSLVGDFARRQYAFASFVTLEEPDGTLSSLQHMNSHSPQAVPYEQWADHKHLVYAPQIPDAVPFAVRAGYAPTTQPGAPAGFIDQQKAMEKMEIKTAPMEFGVRSYPSNYLHLPPNLANYPSSPPPDLTVRTRPMEHLAYAKFFKSPAVRDEFFVRRMPAWHVTIYSGPCRDEVSNAGGRLNGIGAGGLGHVWMSGAGTLLMAATDLSQKPAPDGDFEKVWSQLPVNAIAARQADGKIIHTGWTGSLMDADADGRGVTIRGGVAPALKNSSTTPMTSLAEWQRRITFSPAAMTIEATLNAPQSFQRIAEIIPVARFRDTTLAAINDAGETIAAPWPGRQRVREIRVTRNHRTLHIVPSLPMEVSWGELKIPLSSAVGAADATAIALQLWLEPRSHRAQVSYRIEFDSPDVCDLATIHADDAALPPATAGQPYRIALESAAAAPLYWRLARGELPAGLTLNRNGLLSGTPQSPGDCTFGVAVSSPYAARPFFVPTVPVRDVHLIVRAAH